MACEMVSVVNDDLVFGGKCDDAPGALEDHRVGAAKLGQMIGGAGAGNAAADDQCLHMGGK